MKERPSASPSTDDAVDEGPGSVTVTLLTGTGYTVDTDNDSAMTDVLDDDNPTITIAAVDPRVTEGDGGGVHPEHRPRHRRWTPT